jgi:hypothetical protein
MIGPPSVHPVGVSSLISVYTLSGKKTSQLGRKVPPELFCQADETFRTFEKVLKVCDSDVKENPDGFLSHYLSLRILRSKCFFNCLKRPILRRANFFPLYFGGK